MRIFLNVFLLLILSGQASGQQSLLRHYSIRDGLPSNVVYDIYQDSRGFIWFCTDQGVSRFDGSEFRNFSVEDGLPDDEVFRIREDGNHRYWLISYNRKACYLKNGKVYNSSNDSLCHRIEQAGIRYDELYRFRDGNYALIGPRIGLLTDKPPYLRIMADEHLTESRIYYFRKDDEEYVVAGTRLYNLTRKRTCFTTSCFISEAFYDGQNLFLSKDAIDAFMLEQWQVTKEGVHYVKGIKAPSKIYQMSMLQPGEILCCTSEGILVYDITAGKFRKDNAFPLRKRCNRALKDREGNWWMSTLNGGVYCKPANSATIVDRHSGLAGNNILTVSMAGDGALLTGDDAGNINVMEAEGTKNFAVTRSGAQNRILFVKGIDARTIIAGSDEGMFHIDRRTGIPRSVYHQSFKAATQNGSVLFAGGVTGVIAYDVMSERIAVEITKERVTALETGLQGTLWIGGLKGVTYYEKGKVYAYTHSPELNQSRITSIARGKEGYILVGTSSSGLFIIKDSRLPAIRLTRSEGLSSNTCKRLFAAKNGNIWMCSGKGLDKLSPDRNGNYTAHPFPLPDDISGNSINDLIEDNGQLFLATTEGIVILDSRGKAGIKPPRLYIDAVNNRTITERSLKHVEQFPYGERNIQVAYTGVSFAGGPRLQYKYLLKGGTKDTLFTEAKTINFSALSPGSYELLLWVRSPRSLWTTEPAIVAFHILPPFWLHPVFLTVVILFLVAIILLLYRARIRIVQQRAGKAAQNKQQLAELEMKALRAQINPHFIFNALNSIQSYYSQNDELKANYYMTSFARFIRLTLMHSQSHWLPLSEEIAMLRTYVELEQMRFKQLFTFTLEIDSGINPERLMVPAMLIQPYIENAINHGLRYLEGRKGVLALRVTLESDHLRCIIEDNGVGREQAASNKPLEHVSFGMNINRQRIDAINRMYDITIEVEIVDKQSSYADAGGTLIVLLIPLKKQPIYADHIISR